MPITYHCRILVILRSFPCCALLVTLLSRPISKVPSCSKMVSNEIVKVFVFARSAFLAKEVPVHCSGTDTNHTMKPDRQFVGRPIGVMAQVLLYNANLRRRLEKTSRST